MVVSLPPERQRKSKEIMRESKKMNIFKPAWIQKAETHCTKAWEEEKGLLQYPGGVPGLPPPRPGEEGDIILQMSPPGNPLCFQMPVSSPVLSSSD